MQLEQIGKSLGPECIVCCDFHSGDSGEIWICEKIMWCMEFSHKGGAYVDLEASTIPFLATFESILKSG